MTIVLHVHGKPVTLTAETNLLAEIRTVAAFN